MKEGEKVTDFSFHLLMFLLSAFSSSFIVLSVRMTCYASLLNPKLKVLHAYTHSVRRWMDGWMLGWGDGRPIFFSSSSCWKSTELTHCDDNTRECSKWCGITRSLFPPCRTKPPPHFFLFLLFFPQRFRILARLK